MCKGKISGGIKKFIYNWTTCNIFRFRKGDGIAYLIVVAIALYDIIANFAHDMALQEYVDKK